MDGIFVCADARVSGVGSALLEATKSEARARAYCRVRLDAIDTNPRARHGFVACETASIGPLRYIYGFQSATTMMCPLKTSG